MLSIDRKYVLAQLETQGLNALADFLAHPNNAGSYEVDPRVEGLVASLCEYARAKAKVTRRLGVLNCDTCAGSGVTDDGDGGTDDCPECWDLRQGPYSDEIG